MGALGALFMASLVFMSSKFQACEGEMSKFTLKRIKKVNKNGPYVGILTTTSSEMDPLLDSLKDDVSNSFNFQYIDCEGRRFHFGRIKKKKVIFAMTGKGMINAAVVAKLLLGLFDVRALLHFGTAANANPNLNIGDVTIPQFWAHTGLWNWQRYGDGPDDELPLESDGYFTREIGSLNFADYTNGGGEDNSDNILNSVWYQPEEIFPINQTPESSDQVFWVAVNRIFINLAKKLEGMKLKGCINNTLCLPTPPKVITVEKGSSSNIYLDNVAYRSFLNSKFKVTPVDMESAAIALASHQHKVPFIVFRALSDLAGERSTYSNGVHTFKSLATKNCAKVVLHFLKKMEIPKIEPM
ncbi:bark storage protein A-like [Magnolia sinica]|uniref:bark storage protein A-like n=1 Tax=Magnolia sinica TaxID=86752 RepID=UPI00265B1719|nr:bark storage protein A-like [Magnolia sinica]